MATLQLAAVMSVPSPSGDLLISLQEGSPLLREFMNFFVSYTEKNVKWAKWIVWELEKQRHRCIVQFRDFAPGMSFIRKMREASETDCTLAVFLGATSDLSTANRNLTPHSLVSRLEHE